jgi:hypothetical protein
MRVSGIGAGQRHIGRRLVSCLAAYAFALQMLLVAFAAPAVAGVTSDAEALSAGLCLHDKSAPAAPAQNSGGEEHCKFCPAGQPIFAAPAPPHHAIVRAAEAAPVPPTGAIAPPSRTHASAQPRGPPPAA